MKVELSNMMQVSKKLSTLSSVVERLDYYYEFCYLELLAKLSETVEAKNANRQNDRGQLSRLRYQFFSDFFQCSVFYTSISIPKDIYMEHFEPNIYDVEYKQWMFYWNVFLFFELFQDMYIQDMDDNPCYKELVSKLLASLDKFEIEADIKFRESKTTFLPLWLARTIDDYELFKRFQHNSVLKEGKYIDGAEVSGHPAIFVYAKHFLLKKWLLGMCNAADYQYDTKIHTDTFGEKFKTLSLTKQHLFERMPRIDETVGTPLESAKQTNMPTSSSPETLRGLLAFGKIAAVFEHLRKEHKLEGKLLLLSARFYLNESALDEGILTTDEHKVERHRILKALGKLLNL